MYAQIVTCEHKETYIRVYIVTLFITAESKAAEMFYREHREYGYNLLE